MEHADADLSRYRGKGLLPLVRLHFAEFCGNAAPSATTRALALLDLVRQAPRGIGAPGLVSQAERWPHSSPLNRPNDDDHNWRPQCAPPPRTVDTLSRYLIAAIAAANVDLADDLEFDPLTVEQRRPRVMHFRRTRRAAWARVRPSPRTAPDRRLAAARRWPRRPGRSGHVRRRDRPCGDGDRCASAGDPSPLHRSVSEEGDDGADDGTDEPRRLDPTVVIVVAEQQVTDEPADEAADDTEQPCL